MDRRLDGPQSPSGSSSYNHVVKPSLSTLTRSPDGDLHGQIEEVRVSVTHAVLVEERRHHLAARRLESNAERLVLD